MTTNVASTSDDLEKLNTNVARIEALSQRLIAAIAQKRTANPSLEAPGAELYARAATAMWNEALQNPAKLIEQQVEFWGKTLKHYVEAQHLLAQGKLEAPSDSGPKDRRFANPLWQTHPYFNFVKQQYLRNSKAMDQAVASLEGLSAQDRRRVEYFSKQVMDLLAPTNYLPLRPRGRAS